jgi:LacI family transcriptional regulator
LDGNGRNGKRATVHDVARAAGVSLATVDRVLNGRPGVRPQTAEKVDAAIRALDFRRDLSASLLARARDLSIAFLLPERSNEFMDSLAGAISRRARSARPERLLLETLTYPTLDAARLASQIDALDPRTYDYAVIVATEDAPVRAAIDKAARRGIVVMTIVSDLPGSARKRFIGIDNTAAGRTAASLMGRFLPNGGKVGLIAGSLALRDHRERLEGFSAVMAAEYPHVELVGPSEGADDNARTADVVRAMLTKHPDLAGIYNLGAGNHGLLEALATATRKVRVVAHELTAPTRDALRSGMIDVVLDQNPDGEIRAAVAAAKALALGHAEEHPEPIEIGIFLRDNLR